jgi:hypothetical protein
LTNSKIMVNWSAGNNAKLLLLLEGNTVDSANLAQEGIERVSSKQFLVIEYKKFAPLYCKMVHKWNVE